MDFNSDGMNMDEMSDYCVTKLGVFISYLIFIALVYPAAKCNINTTNVLLFIAGLCVGELFLIVNIITCSTYYILHAITYFIIVSSMTIIWYCYNYKKNFHENFNVWNPDQMRFPRLHRLILRVMSCRCCGAVADVVE